jgi:phage tail protein X
MPPKSTTSFSRTPGPAKPPVKVPGGGNASPSTTPSPGAKQKPPMGAKKASNVKGMALGRPEAIPDPATENDDKKKAAPKTLAEVAEAYNFSVDQVRAANPALKDLGENEKLPKGTKLALPKRTADSPGPGNLKPTMSAMELVKQKADEARKKQRDQELARERAEQQALAEDSTTNLSHPVHSQANLKKPASSAAMKKVASTVGATGGDGAKKKGPPKTLAEVAEQYDFEFEEVRKANPDLAHLGPNDRLPVGTKLQLPKRKPTLAQLSLKLDAAEKEHRSIVDQEYEKEADNFWYLLRLEKRSMMRTHEEYMAIVKAHATRRDALMRERFTELREVAAEEYDRRVTILTRRLATDEIQPRRAIQKAERELFELVLAKDEFFRGAIEAMYKRIKELEVEVTTTSRRIVDEEDAARRHFLQRGDFETEHLRTIPQAIEAPENSERESIRGTMMHDRAAVEEYLRAFFELHAKMDNTRQATEAEEAQERATVDDASTASKQQIAELYASRGDFEASCLETQRITAHEEAKARNDLETLLAQWTDKMSTVEVNKREIFAAEAAAEESLVNAEASSRENIRGECGKHREWTQEKLDAQAAVRTHESRLREEAIVTERQRELQAMQENEIAERLDAQDAEWRAIATADESEGRAALTETALALHELARKYRGLMDALTAEALASVPRHHERLLTQFVDEFSAAARELVSEETLARQNGPVTSEGDERTTLNRRLQDLHVVARRFIAEEQQIRNDEDNQAFLMQEHERRDWQRMSKWNADRIVMIVEGKSELEFLEMEEGHGRAALDAERNQDVFRVTAVAEESRKFARRKLDEQSEMYWLEHHARKVVVTAETGERDELKAVQLEDGRKAWREYMARMFDELLGRILGGETSGREDVEAEQGRARKALVDAERSGHEASKADETARTLREMREAELRERHRKQRSLLEKSHESERESSEYTWRTELFAIVVGGDIVKREAIVRRELEHSAEPTALATLTQAFQDGILQIDRDKLVQEEVAARSVVSADEESSWEMWRKERLAAHYEIWKREAAERLRMEAKHRTDMVEAEEAARAGWIKEFGTDVTGLEAADKAGQKEAARLEQVRIEEHKRAVKEWEERKWFARKKLGDDEADGRREELQLPEAAARSKIHNAEGRARRMAEAEATDRVMREVEEAARRQRELEARVAEERRLRLQAIEDELNREREKERQRQLQRQKVQRDRVEEKEAAARANAHDGYGKWAGETTATMQASHTDATDRQAARLHLERIHELEQSEDQGRRTIDDEADAASGELQRRLARRYTDAVEQERQRRMKAVWNTVIGIDIIDQVIDLETDESSARRDVTSQWDRAFRSWVDAIAIEEQLIEAAGRRLTTQKLLERNEEEFEERGLLRLLEGLLRLHMEAEYDRRILYDWEERCTDALHAHAIDTIDAYLTLGPIGLQCAGMLLLPVCHPRPTFETPRDQAFSTLPSLAGTSFALTPRPPAAVLASVSATPGRMQQRLKQYELRGAAGTPAHMFSMMQRFDSECRSEYSTPFAGSPNTQRFRPGFSARTPGVALPQIMPSPTPTPLETSPVRAIMDKAPRPPPMTQPRTARPASRSLPYVPPAVAITPAALRRHRTASANLEAIDA